MSDLIWRSCAETDLLSNRRSPARQSRRPLNVLDLALQHLVADDKRKIFHRDRSKIKSRYRKTSRLGVMWGTLPCMMKLILVILAPGAHDPFIIPGQMSTLKSFPLLGAVAL